MDIWNNHYQDKMKIKNKQEIDQISFADKLVQFEEIMASTQELMDSNTLNTDFLENLIEENNSYFEKDKPKNNSHSDLFITEEDIDCDIDENYLGGSSALLQAENILKKLKNKNITSKKNNESKTKEIKKHYLNIEKEFLQKKNSSQQTILELYGSPSKGSF